MIMVILKPVILLQFIILQLAHLCFRIHPFIPSSLIPLYYFILPLPPMASCTHLSSQWFRCNWLVLDLSFGTLLCFDTLSACFRWVKWLVIVEPHGSRQVGRKFLERVTPKLTNVSLCISDNSCYRIFRMEERGFTILFISLLDPQTRGKITVAIRPKYPPWCRNGLIQDHPNVKEGLIIGRDVARSLLWTSYEVQRALKSPKEICYLWWLSQANKPISSGQFRPLSGIIILTCSTGGISFSSTRDISDLLFENEKTLLLW